MDAPLPSLGLVARLQEIELGLEALRAQVGAEISPSYAAILGDGALIVRCTRLEAERLRSLATGELPLWAFVEGAQEDTEEGTDALEVAASATDGGD